MHEQQDNNAQQNGQGHGAASSAIIDAEAIAKFVGALFKHADSDGFVMLRAFIPGGNGTKPAVSSLSVPARSPAEIAKRATKFAEELSAPAKRATSAPTVAIFRNTGRTREEDLANGLVLSVDCDKAPAAARTKLEAVLGRPMVEVASGGVWTHPDTKELQGKLHLYWRLKTPTRTPAQRMVTFPDRQR